LLHDYASRRGYRSALNEAGMTPEGRPRRGEARSAE
jgi:hypothetical protein